MRGTRFAGSSNSLINPFLFQSQAVKCLFKLNALANVLRQYLHILFSGLAILHSPRCWRIWTALMNLQPQCWQINWNINGNVKESTIVINSCMETLVFLTSKPFCQIGRLNFEPVQGILMIVHFLASKSLLSRWMERASESRGLDELTRFLHSAWSSRRYNRNTSTEFFYSLCIGSLFSLPGFGLSIMMSKTVLKSRTRFTSSIHPLKWLISDFFCPMFANCFHANIGSLFWNVWTWNLFQQIVVNLR